MLKKDKQLLGLIAVTTIFLSGCVQAVSNEDTKELILPSIVEYSPETQKRLNQELEGGSCRMSEEFIIDYGIMRDETREALK